MTISEMIAEGNRILEAQKAAEEASRAEDERQIDAIKEQVYQMVAELLPPPLGDYLDRTCQYEPSISTNLVIGPDGNYHNQHTMDNYHNLQLAIPACAPIWFSVYLDRKEISNIKVGAPKIDDEGNLYWSHRYSEPQDNIYIALALSGQEYTKFGKIEAKRTARLLVQEPPKPSLYSMASSALETADHQAAIAYALVGIYKHLHGWEA